MHIEHVDVLRCPRPHEASWLVASIEVMEAREIVRGTLGCPVCGAEYPVRDREVQLGGTPSPSCELPDPQETLRLAALLDLAEPGGVVVLAGGLGAHATSLRAMMDQRLVLLDAPANVATEQGVYAVSAPPASFPFGDGVLRAVALDEARAHLTAAAARALRAGGRLVAPAATPLPAEVRELARDDRQWVGERVGAPALVGLKRA